MYPNCSISKTLKTLFLQTIWIKSFFCLVKIIIKKRQESSDVYRRYIYLNILFTWSFYVHTYKEVRATTTTAHKQIHNDFIGG